jgi:hypothetical protein
MNKDEKKLAEKVLAFYNSQSKAGSGFTHDENIILERWRAHRIINEEAFEDLTPMNAGYKEYYQKLEYPFTAFGDEERKKDWYLHFRNSKGISIVRDILTVIAFLLSLYLTISNLIQ